jgi:hypothetical protein
MHPHSTSDLSAQTHIAITVHGAVIIAIDEFLNISIQNKPYWLFGFRAI